MKHDLSYIEGKKYDWTQTFDPHCIFLPDPTRSMPAMLAKVQGLFSTFKCHELLVTVCGSLDLLELIVRASNVSGEGGLLLYKVQLSV